MFQFWSLLNQLSTDRNRPWFRFGTIFRLRSYWTYSCYDTTDNDWIDSIFSKNIIKCSTIETVECVFCNDFSVLKLHPNSTFEVPA